MSEPTHAHETAINSVLLLLYNILCVPTQCACLLLILRAARSNNAARDDRLYSIYSLCV